MNDQVHEGSDENDTKSVRKLHFVLDEVENNIEIDNLISMPILTSKESVNIGSELTKFGKKNKQTKKMEDLFTIDPDLAIVDTEEYKRQIKIQKDQYIREIRNKIPSKTKKKRKIKNMEDIFGNLDNLDPEILKQTIQHKKEEYIKKIKNQFNTPNSSQVDINDRILDKNIETKVERIDVFDDKLQNMRVDELRLELNTRKKNYYKFIKNKKVSEIALDLSHLELIINYISLKSSDFSYYKPSFIYRRIKKRISRLKIKTLSEYLDHLRFNENEISILKDELSINVTQFMRDKNTWEYLEKVVLPSMMKNRKIRVWSAATAIGCEAYSLAIINYRISNTNYEIIGTDINNKLLAKARRGYYGSLHLKAFTQPELNQFFTGSNDSYKIKSFLQKSTRFYKLDLISDNFPKNIDIVLARNIWIYFNNPEQIYKKMYDSLNCGGYLLLGGTEIIPAKLRNMFEIVNIETQTYQKICQ